MNTRKIKGKIEYIVIHHACIPQTYTDGTCERILVEEAKKLFGSDFGGLYNYTILPSGTSKQLVPPGFYAPHCGFNQGEGSTISNDNSIGISVCAKMDTEKTLKPAIMSGLVNEVKWLMKQHHIPVERVKKHSDIVATNCPGTFFPWTEFISKLKEDKMKLYPDVDEKRWSFQAIEYLTKLKIMTGDEKGFRPTEPCTREELAQVIYNVLKGGQ